MVRVIVVVREVGKLKPDYSLEFNLPEVPRVGSYISIHRPDKPKPYGEDMIVRQVWWRLEHPETNVIGTEPVKVGSLEEIMVECEPAIGPYASDAWREALEMQSGHAGIEEFEIARFSVRESELFGSKK